MKPSLTLFWIYTKKLIKNWILWIFLVLDLIAVIVKIFIPFLKLPQSLYYLIALIGLIWAGFNSYLELLEKIPSEARPIKPEISIMSEEGNEYAYTFDQSMISELRKIRKAESKEGEEYTDPLLELSIPKSQLTYFARLENTGLVVVNLLTINARIDFDTPYRFMVPDVFLSEGTQISYPLLLQPKEILHLKIIDNIYKYSLLSDAQIAARTRILLEQKKILISQCLLNLLILKGKCKVIKKYSAYH
jgi:hypothetical protein